MAIFNLAVSALGYQCMQAAKKTDSTGAKFLLFNIVVSTLAIVGLLVYGGMTMSKGRNNGNLGNLKIA